MTSQRFNLDLLRSRTKADLTFRGGPFEAYRVSRRAFLSMSVATSAGVILPALLSRDAFAIVREGTVIRVSTNQLTRWVIDPAVFGPGARTSLHEDNNRSIITLRNAVFPGTELAADFDCLITKQSGEWGMQMEMACGPHLRANFLDWLHLAEPAAGRLRRTTLSPFEGFDLAFSPHTQVRFTPQWALRISGEIATRVAGLAGTLPIEECELLLNPEDRIAAGPVDGTTCFILSRGNQPWTLSLGRSSQDGWSIRHDDADSLFDTLTVEAAARGTGKLQSALFVQSRENPASLRFYPGGNLVANSGEPFHLLLTNPRLAMALGETAKQSAFVADFNDAPVWAHGENASYQIVPGARESGFELLDAHDGAASPQVSPDICQICFPDDETSLNLRFDVPRPFRMTWADVKSPFERLWGLLRLSPSRHDFDIFFDGEHQHLLQVDRPRDLLSLGFQFNNFLLRTGRKPRLFAIDPQLWSQIAVVFPPQHIAEEAFFHVDDQPKIPLTVQIGDVEVRRLLRLSESDPVTPAQRQEARKMLDAESDRSSSEADKPAKPGAVDENNPRPATILSGESRIVFRIRPGQEIPLSLQSLLEWDTWEPKVAAVAESHVNVDDESKLPNIERPVDVTAIELPYRVILSPSELGRWVHSVAPALHETNVVELWHTRLAAALKPTAGPIPKAGRPDEGNAKDRTVRVIWSDDYVPVQRDCKDHRTEPQYFPISDLHLDRKGFPLHYSTQKSPPPENESTQYHNPFRMALDSRDRNELVHLTSNYDIPKPYDSCQKVLKQSDLLAPAPVQVDRLMLTSLGGYLNSFGAWDPPKIDETFQLTVEQWKQVTTLGRDHYVRVVYKGYLLPFGHRASLVKVTERKLITNLNRKSDGVVAILHQRMFVVVQNPIKDFPSLGQRYGGRAVPFRRVEVMTLITPDIAEPTAAWPKQAGKHQSQSLFWPTVTGKPLPFRFRFTDVAGRTSESSMPVVFADAEVSQNLTGGGGAYSAKDAVELFNDGYATADLRDEGVAADFSNQKVSFASSTKPGDTQYDAATLSFKSEVPPADLKVLALYKAGLPYFYPILDFGFVSSASIKRISGNSAPTRVRFFQTYLDFAFDPAKNRGEVILQVQDDVPLQLSFGGSGKVDKAGGLSSPDILVAGFSRLSGPVGGQGANGSASSARPPSLDAYSTGNFNANDFLGGLTSAKILGGIRLADVIAALAPGAASNIERAPKMLEQSLYQVGDVLGRVVVTIREFQDLTLAPSSGGANIPNPLATHLAAHAQRVYTLKAAADAASKARADEKDSVVKLADEIQEADLDRQLIGSIYDYASALDAVVSNPAALVEETLASAFQSVLNDYVLPLEGALLRDLHQSVDALVDLTNDGGPLANALTKFEALRALAGEEIVDDLLIRRDTLLHIGQNLRNRVRFDEFARGLATAGHVVDTVQDLRTRIGSLAKEVTQARLETIPSFLSDLNAILEDILALYQATALLGILDGKPAVVTAVRGLETSLGAVWLQTSYYIEVANRVKYDATLVALESLCMQFAATVNVDVGKRILQNLRQCKSAVDEMRNYAVLLPETLSPKEFHRFVQVLQQLQRQIISGLAALQTLGSDPAVSAVVPIADLTAYSEAITAAVSAFTVADALVSTPVETMVLTTLASSPELSNALSAQVMDIKEQLSRLRTQLGANPNDIGLKLLHLDLSQRMGGLFNAAVEWVLFHLVPDAAREINEAINGLVELNTLVDLLEQKIALTIGSALCAMQPPWVAFRKSLYDQTGLTKVLKVLIDAALVAFEPSLGAIDGAFGAICAAVQPRPKPISEVLADAHNLIAAFSALYSNVRSTVGGLGNLNDAAKLVLQDALAQAATLKDALLRQIPIPTSVSLSYDWRPELKPFEPVFLLRRQADFVVSARANISLPGVPGSKPPSFDIDAQLTNFSINLIGNPSFVIVDIDELHFTSHNGSSPDCQVQINAVRFGQDMSFVKSLADALNPSKGPFIELADGGLTAGYRFAIECLPSPPMTVMGLAVEVAVTLPFNGDPVRCSFGLADQQHPFLLSFGIYGGGGFLQLQLGLDGVQLLQGALEFGLVAKVTIGPLQGSGFIVAGIYFRIQKNNSSVCGFVHAHGHVDIFGLISLDVDLYVGICYDKGVVRGTATFSVHVQILFFSETFEMQATYTFSGSNQAAEASIAPPLLPWQQPQRPQEAFLVSPDAGGNFDSPTPSTTTFPAFIDRTSWIAYVGQFEF